MLLKRDIEDVISKFEDPDREGLEKTPERVERMLNDELLRGYSEDPSEYLEVQFDEDYDEIVIVDNIDFYSMCEHHMLPFYGKAHVGYLPSGKVVGASKLARVTDVFARRLQNQERMTKQIADAIYDSCLEPKGVAVYVEGIHLCMRMRGIKKQNNVMKTSAVRGKFLEDENMEEKFLMMIDRDEL